MSRWFRHYAGMMRDEKLVRVSIRSGQPIERVVWIWGAILESAAEIDDNGRYDLDAAEVAYFLRADEGDVVAVLDALAGATRVAEGRVVNWSNRQFISDRSAHRVAAHRERKRSAQRGDNTPQDQGNDTVTLQQPLCNAPDTETEKETELPPQPPRKRRGKTLAAKPDEVSDQLWSDVLALRDAKRAPLTESAFETIKREAGKAGWPLVEALEKMVARGWQGFEAQWVEARNVSPLKPADPAKWATFCDERAAWERKIGRDGEADDWAAKARAARQRSTGPPRAIGEIILREGMR